MLLRHAGARMDQLDAKTNGLSCFPMENQMITINTKDNTAIQDIKQALRELNERKINSYALAIEAQAKYYLPQMFGQNHCQILTSPKLY